MAVSKEAKLQAKQIAQETYIWRWINLVPEEEVMPRAE